MLAVRERNRIGDSSLQLSPPRSRVCVLVREKAGKEPALYKTFSHVEPAEAFIQDRLKSGAKQGFLVFWMLPGDSVDGALDEDQRAQIMVLVPDKKRTDYVRPFTYPELVGSREALRRQFEGSGAIITWALSIELTCDERGSVSLSPSTPPPTVPAELSETLQSDVHEALSFAADSFAANYIEEVPDTPFALEVRRVLAIPRWEFIPGSFSGFHSPPGRF